MCLSWWICEDKMQTIEITNPHTHTESSVKIKIESSNYRNSFVDLCVVALFRRDWHRAPSSMRLLTWRVCAWKSFNMNLSFFDVNFVGDYIYIWYRTCENKAYILKQVSSSAYVIFFSFKYLLLFFSFFSFRCCSHGLSCSPLSDDWYCIRFEYIIYILIFDASENHHWIFPMKFFVLVEKKCMVCIDFV